MLIKNQRRPFILLTLIIILLLFLFIQEKVKPRKKDEINISVAKQNGFALIYIADKKGYFEDEGLKVNFRKHVLGRDALNDLVENRADFATVFDVPVLNEINKGTDLAILTTLHTADKNHAIVAFRKSGIKIPSDLRGKKVAMTKGVSTEYFLYSFLITEGINLEEVNIVSIEPDQLIPNLENNQIDAAVLFNPYIFNLQKKYPANQLVLLYSNAYKDISVLTAKKDYVVQERDKTTRILRALYKAEKYIKANRVKSIKLVDEWLDNYDSEAVQSSWDNIDFSLTLSNRLLTMMQRESNFFSSAGIYKTDTPYIRKYIPTIYLKDVKPEGVTIY